MAWQSIESAPKTFNYDVTLDGMRFRGGTVIKVRGTCQGETEEFFVHWSQMDDGPAHWFIFDTEPLDWPAEEWRPVTDAEEFELFGDEGQPANLELQFSAEAALKNCP